jgi:hypothetical protein
MTVIVDVHRRWLGCSAIKPFIGWVKNGQSMFIAQIMCKQRSRISGNVGQKMHIKQ